MDSSISLVWALKLSTSALQEILKDMSAVDLAAAWTGPPELLKHLSSSINERKLKLVQSYVSKGQVDRGSSVYAEIHRRVLSQLRTDAQKNETVDVVAQGAA